ncbi:hypothetical protein ABZS29_03155 [Kribbella sp. NPDC005582]|uniref:hypothetical protein n=1 Tax=Kribbella sp. NPDC005582 TaxID=3156893 RepID=UPI00339EBD7E
MRRVGWFVVGGVLAAGLVVTPPRVAVLPVAAEVGLPSAGDGRVSPLVGHAVDVALARQAVAFRRGDERGFLQEVAPGAVERQARMFRGLRALEAQVGFRRREVWVDPGAVRRYGAGAVTLRVSMRYAVTDLKPAVEDLGYTYVIRDGVARLVDATRLDAVLRSNRQPWDVAELEVVRRAGVVVLVDRGERARGEQIAAVTAQAAKVVDKLWSGPLQKIPLVVALKDPDVLTDLPATLPGQEPIRIQPMHSAAPDGRPVGGWIVLAPGAAEAVGAQPRVVPSLAEMVHGLMHLMPVKMGDEAPRWLAEGLAAYAANLVRPAPDVARERAAVADAVRGRIDRLPSDDEFTTTDSYRTSWLAVDLMARAVGVGSVTRFYLQVARRGYSEFARARMMREYAGITAGDLVANLRGPAA